MFLNMWCEQIPKVGTDEANNNICPPTLLLASPPENKMVVVTPDLRIFSTTTITSVPLKINSLIQIEHLCPLEN